MAYATTKRASKRRFSIDHARALDQLGSLYGNRQQLRVLIVSGEVPPARGGVAGYVGCLWRQLLSDGHDVAIMSGVDSVGQDQFDPELDGATTLPVEGWGLRHRKATLREVDRWQPDRVLFMYAPQMYQRAGLALGAAFLPGMMRRDGVQVITVLHELFVPWGASVKSVAVSSVQRLCLQLVIAGSDRLIVSNPRIHRVLQHMVKDPTTIRELPVGATILPVVSGLSDKEVLLAKLHITGCTIAGSIAVGSIYKRPLDLVELLSRIGDDARVLCLGGRSDDQIREAELVAEARHRQVENRLVWTGDLSAPQMSRHLQIVDIYIHTGEHGVSGRSTSLASALAHGLPTIGYRGSETSDWLAESGAFILSAPGDVDGLVAAFCRLQESPALRSELGKNARRIFDERLRWSVLARDVLASE